MALSTPQPPAGANRKSVPHVLFEKGKITREQGADIMGRMKSAPGSSVDEVLLTMGISDVDITQAKAEIAGVPFVDLVKSAPSEEAKSLVPDDLQSRLRATPLMIEGNTLVVAMDDPKNFHTVDDLKMRTKMEIRAVMAAPSQLEAFKNGKPVGGMALNGNGANGHANGNGSAEAVVDLDAAPTAPEVWEKYDEDVAGMLGGLAPVEQIEDPNSKKKKKVEVVSEEDAASAGTVLGAESVAGDQTLAEEAPIIRIVNTVLLYALKDGASDIHVEPQQKGVRIRYRIDGVLHEQMKIPQYVLAPLISRIKIMSEMNIAERRIPQDGRIKLTMQGKEYDMRVNTCPTVWGEKVVMRILDKSSVMLGLDKIGLYPDHQAELLDIATQPNGMLYVCGPTGSGKTTTLYSLLNVVSTIEKNVSTVEDPVEYQLPGLTQVQVNRKAGLTFSTALRAFLRQDPDIIMVGEIRDLETAEIAVQASLTGHFVLSTIHTNDAPSTATRLGDMGVEPFLISASLTGALAQRLARTICKNCKEEYNPPREILMRFGFDPLRNPEQKFWHGRGCEVCKQTGFKGRTGLYELMRVNEEIQELIVRRAPVNELKDAARSNGMRTLQEDGFQKCKDGHTTVEEVMRVVFTGGH
ncbi:MAG: Flp pilus assembly complex ATPase component TadA [Armatimonadetes bacterium]|nr:Flp pilus assembly complex ATPase component TadA [Armatimonadota bacterium]